MFLTSIYHLALNLCLSNTQYLYLIAVQQMEPTKKSTKSFSTTLQSEVYRQHRFTRNNSNSMSRSAKSLAQSQSSSLSKFYVKNAYANSKLGFADDATPQIGPTQKIKQKMNQNQCNGNSRLIKSSKLQADLAKKTIPLSVSIPQLLEQFQRLKGIVKAQANINLKQKLLLSQVRLENQALKKQINIFKQKQSNLINNSEQRSRNKTDQSLSFTKPAREINEQNVGLESDQISKLRKKIEQISQENFLLKKTIKNQSSFWHKDLRISSDSESLSMQPYIEKMKAQLYQARQQVKRVHLLNAHLQRKSFKQAQCQLKSKTLEYNQLRNKYSELLDKYNKIRKQHVESLSRLKRFEQNQNSMKESLNFSQLSVRDDIFDSEFHQKQENFFSGVKKRTIYS